MLVTAVFVPSPPVLVPEVAAGAAGELDELRHLTLSTVRTALERGVDRVVLLAGGPPRSWPSAPATFVRLGLPGSPADDRPLALQVGRWLLDAAGWTGPTAVEAVDGSAPPEHLEPGRVAVLVLGDGSARRSAAAPGYVHPDAEAYDERVGRALGEVDAGALLSLDPADDERLLVAGRPAWQATARAVAGESGWSGELLWSGAPYGVGYLLAEWWR